MKKVNFALVCDVLFIALCAFIISFVTVRYFVKNLTVTIISSALIAAAAAVLSAVALYKRRQKKMTVYLGDREKKSLAVHLSVSGEEYVEKLFLSALDGTYPVANGIEDDGTSYYFNFKLSPVTPDDIAAVIKADGGKKKRLYCCAATPEALSFANDFTIEVCTVEKVYMLLKDRGLLPEKYELGKAKERGLISRIKARFNRRLCPSLFFCGLTLIFFSFFTFYPAYYVVAGGLLMLAAAVSVVIDPK